MPWAARQRLAGAHKFAVHPDMQARAERVPATIGGTALAVSSDDAWRTAAAATRWPCAPVCAITSTTRSRNLSTFPEGVPLQLPASSKAIRSILPMHKQTARCRVLLASHSLPVFYY